MSMSFKASIYYSLHSLDGDFYSKADQIGSPALMFQGPPSERIQITTVDVHGVCTICVSLKRAQAM